MMKIKIISTICISFFVIVAAIFFLMFYIYVIQATKFSLFDNASTKKVEAAAYPILKENFFGIIGSPPNGDQKWYEVFYSEKNEIKKMSLHEKADFIVLFF